MTATKEQVQKEISEIVKRLAGEGLEGYELGTDTDFTDTGISSLEYLEFVDIIEMKYGIFVDLEADDMLSSVDKFVDYIVREMDTASAASSKRGD
jgi:acyl carrier protein